MTLGRIIALPIAPIHNSFSGPESTKKKKLWFLVSTLKLFSKCKSSSADLMLIQSRTLIVSVGEVLYPFCSLKVYKAVGVRTVHRRLQLLKNRDRFSAQPSFSIVSKLSAEKSN
jgi:hypothetical protein